MTGLYLFCTAVGVPLLIWFAFVGDGDDGGGDGDGPLGFLSVATLSFAMAFFGLSGLAFGALGAASALTFMVAAIVGVLAAVLNSWAMRWLRHNSTSSEVADSDLEGTIAAVTLPISAEHRGKIILTKAGAREQMTASPVGATTIDSGEQVVIVRVERGVALVTPLGSDLD